MSVFNRKGTNCKVIFAFKVSPQYVNEVRVIGSCPELGNNMIVSGTPLLSDIFLKSGYYYTSIDLKRGQQISYSYAISSVEKPKYVTFPNQTLSTGDSPIVFIWDVPKFDQKKKRYDPKIPFCHKKTPLSIAPISHTTAYVTFPNQTLSTGDSPIVFIWDVPKFDQKKKRYDPKIPFCHKKTPLSIAPISHTTAVIHFGHLNHVPSLKLETSPGLPKRPDIPSFSTDIDENKLDSHQSLFSSLSTPNPKFPVVGRSAPIELNPSVIGDNEISHVWLAISVGGFPVFTRFNYAVAFGADGWVCIEKVTVPCSPPSESSKSTPSHSPSEESAEKQDDKGEVKISQTSTTLTHMHTAHGITLPPLLSAEFYQDILSPAFSSLCLPARPIVLPMVLPGNAIRISVWGEVCISVGKGKKMTNTSTFIPLGKGSVSLDSIPSHGDITVPLFCNVMDESFTPVETESGCVRLTVDIATPVLGLGQCRKTPPAAHEIVASPQSEAGEEIVTKMGELTIEKGDRKDHEAKKPATSSIGTPSNIFISSPAGSTTSSLFIGHRGCGSNKLHGKHRVCVQENTPMSYALAHQVGADGVELDVQMSRDGELVINHDFFVEKKVPRKRKEREKGKGKGSGNAKDESDIEVIPIMHYSAADFEKTSTINSQDQLSQKKSVLNPKQKWKAMGSVSLSSASEAPSEENSKSDEDIIQST
ncbi:Glycerophosphodiester phosphodiesterase Gde1 like protein, partial [Aduncisulcus paluster]